MKPIKLIVICFILSVQSCKSDKSSERAQIKQPFDLADLALNEDINDILSSAKLSKKDTIKNDDLTYLGNEKYTFKTNKLLKFKGIILEGKNGNDVNNLVFHFGKVDNEIGPLYNEKNDVLGMYQLNIYTKIEEKSLFEALKTGLNKPVFDTVKEGVESDIVDNNIIPTKNKFKQVVYIWKNKNLVYYYFKLEMQNRPQEDICKLFVFNSKHKEWMDLLSALGYPHIDEILK